MAAERIAPKAADKPETKKVTPASPIGIFDSGVGGLTVLREIIRQLPHEDVVYLADTARLPYGGRSPEEIVKFNEEIIPYLIGEGVKLIVMACGTSSAIAYPVLKDKYKVHLVSLVEPGARSALAATRSRVIGLFATAGTVNSHAYQTMLHSLDNDVVVHARACPLFVPLIEGGFIEAEETRKVVKEYLKPLLKENIDTLILGCTHYPHLARVIQEIAGPNVTLVDPAAATVLETKKLLDKAGTIKDNSHQPKYDYLVTGSPIQFQDLGSRLLGKPINRVRQVVL
ncbi:MAG: glutamate racemase [Candidatus Margulisiibacteriota bacterium]